jgi:hypothetical protein
MSNRRPGRPVPDDGRFALVRDADAGDVTRGDPGLAQRRLGAAKLCRPDLAGIVLDPTRLRIDLAELLLRRSDDAAAAIEDDGT